MDLRSTTPGSGEPTVLEDVSGRRARWMRRGGRVVFVLFSAWLVAILLGGIGLSPVPGIPLTHALRPSHGPPPLARPLHPRPPSASDLRPALPAVARAHGRRHGPPGAKPVPARGRSSLAPGHGGAPRGRSPTAPGHAKTTIPQGRDLRGNTSHIPPGKR
jgi:hypothetical protein